MLRRIVVFHVQGGWVALALWVGGGGGRLGRAGPPGVAPM